MRKLYEFQVTVRNGYELVDWVSCMFDNSLDGSKWARHMERVLSKHYNNESLSIFYEVFTPSNNLTRYVKTKQPMFGVVEYCCELWDNKRKYPYLFNANTQMRGSFRGA